MHNGRHITIRMGHEQDEWSGTLDETLTAALMWIKVRSAVDLGI